MQEHQDRIETVDETIEALAKTADRGPGTMGSGLGGGSATELANERRWVESLANGIHKARTRATRGAQVDRLTAIGAKWGIRVAVLAAALAAFGCGPADPEPTGQEGLQNWLDCYGPCDKLTDPAAMAACVKKCNESH